MKLEFEQNIAPADIFEELDFNGFLSYFDLGIPLIPRKILRPLTKEQGQSHFRHLYDLQAKVDHGELEIKKLIGQTRRLPLLDSLIVFFKDRGLEQYHLYDLGRFVFENETLARLEENCPLAPEISECCAGIRAILEEYTENGFSSLVYTKEEEEISNQVEELGHKIQAGLSTYENEIYGQTGLKMIYPYPREISAQAENISKIRSCRLLRVKKRENICLIDFRLPPELEKITREKDRLSEKFAMTMQKKLETINRKLQPLFKDFAAYYEERKNRVFYYSLLWVKNQYSLTFPVFQDNFGCTLKSARLPCLEEQVKKYIPLNIGLNRGSNVLFGANMTGKTTVLKTLYFHLTAIRMGLPVPAGSAVLHFPEQVELHLKTSGSIRTSLSSFGEEIRFFSRKISSYAYILADELFQSTDPVSGTVLSEIFLSEFSDKDMVFFCTSHYPDVLKLGTISLFRMKDPDFEEQDIKLEDLLNKMPYTLERISHDKIDDALEQTRKALLIALNFSLPESIKTKMLSALRSYKDRN
jgi:hypothetical protein